MGKLEWLALGVAVSIASALGLAWFLRPEDFVSGESEDPTAPDGPAGDLLDPVYVLARAIASEEGGQPRRYLEQVGCAIVNFARHEFPHERVEDAVVDLVLGSARAFGHQGSGGRRVASTHEPAALQLQIAADILGGRIADETQGAWQFDSPSGQRAQLARGQATRTPEEVAAIRYGDGFELVVVPGIDPDRLRFWVRG